MFYQILSLPGKLELNGANFFRLKAVLEKIVINLHHDEIMRYSQGKKILLLPYLKQAGK